MKYIQVIIVEPVYLISPRYLWCTESREPVTSY